jgi:hypothetical protein
MTVAFVGCDGLADAALQGAAQEARSWGSRLKPTDAVSPNKINAPQIKSDREGLAASGPMANY